jgi:hypothetical protein
MAVATNMRPSRTATPVPELLAALTSGSPFWGPRARGSSHSESAVMVPSLAMTLSCVCTELPRAFTESRRLVSFGSISPNSAFAVICPSIVVW